MTFASPSVLLLLGLLLPAIIALHTMRREEHATASLFLWTKVSASQRGARKRRSIPWRNPHLWLHLLIATLGVLALSTPRLGFGSHGDHVIVLLDASTTMRTTDVAPNRFEAARTWVADTWGTPGKAPAVTLIRVAEDVQTLALRVPSGPLVLDALARAQASNTPPSWQRALLVANDLAAQGNDDRLVILTDGTTDAELERAIALSDASSRFTVDAYRLGGAIINAGVANLEVLPRGTSANRWIVQGEIAGEGLEQGDVVRVQAFFRPMDVDTSLPWTGLDVAVDRAGTGQFELPIDLPGDGILEVRTPAGDQRASDDAVRTVLQAESANTRIGIIGPQPPALIAALRAVGNLQVTAFEEVPSDSVIAAFDLIIITEPTDQPINTSVLYLGASPDAFVAEPRRGVTDVVTERPGHPLLIDVDASEMGITSSQILDLPEGAVPLVSSRGAVLAWARTTSTGRQVALGFRLEDSSWEAQLSFPIFVSSLVSWARSTPATAVTSCQTGIACPLPTTAFAGDWQLQSPSGSILRAPALIEVTGDAYAARVWTPGTFDAAFVPTQVGLYELSLPSGRTHWMAVNEPMRLAGDRDVDMQPLFSALPSQVGARIPQVWQVLAGLVAALLVVEAVLVFRANQRSLSARSRSGRRVAVWTLASVGLALVFAGSAAFRTPSLRVAPSATHVVYSSSLERNASMQDAITRFVEALLGWNRVNLAVGAVTQASQAREPWTNADTFETAWDHLDALTRDQGPVVIDARELGDADVTTVFATSLLQQAQQAGSPWALWSPPSSDDSRLATPDRVIQRIDVPALPKAGAAFDVLLTLGELSEDAVLEVWSAEEALLASQPIAAGDGGETTTLSLQSGDAGANLYTVVARASSGTEVAEIATEQFIVNVAEPLSVLLVASDTSDGELLVNALEAQRIDVTRVPPNRIPATMERLSAFDAVVVLDVPASEIHPFHQDMLLTYVRDEGRGLILLGGSRSFGPGGYYSTLLDEVSPLSSRIEEDAPEIAMTFVLDRSGSMNAVEGPATRMDLAKLATFEAIRLLGEKSQAALIAFDSIATTLLPLQSTANVAPFRSALQNVVAAGGTSIYPALVQAYEVVAASDSATRHIIVMTDGLSEEGDFEEILTRIRSLGVNTSFVGVGDAASRGQLNRLSGYGGGSLHFTNDARALPGILAQEALMLSADPVEERVTQPRWTDGVPPTFLTSAADPLPTDLLGYIKTTAKDEATVLLEDSASGDPLLATWRYGLGRVAAFTSEADGPWSGGWTQEEDYATFWSQLARWSAMTVPAEPYRLTVAIADLHADVALDVPPLDIGGMPPVVELVDARGQRVGQRQVMANPDANRWVARVAIPASDAETYTLRIQVSEEIDDAGVLSYAFVNAPTSWRTHSPLEVMDLAALGNYLEVATEGDGRGRNAVGNLWVVVPSVTWTGDARVWLAAAVALFMLALLLRFGVLPIRMRSTRTN